MISSLVKAALTNKHVLGSAASFGAAHVLDRYSEGNFSDSTKTLASMASFGLRWHGSVRGLQGATGLAGSGMKRAAIGLRNKAPKANDLARSIYRAGSFLQKTGVDKIGGLTPFNLGKTTGGFVGKNLLNPKAYVQGAASWMRAGAESLKYGGKNWSQGWNNLSMRINQMDHPFLGAAAFGAPIGVAGALLNRYRPSASGEWEYDPIAAPMVNNPHERASVGGFHPESFGGGIQFGRSAVKSPNVMDGQEAVVRKMLTRNR